MADQVLPVLGGTSSATCSWWDRPDQLHLQPIPSNTAANLLITTLLHIHYSITLWRLRLSSNISQSPLSLNHRARLPSRLFPHICSAEASVTIKLSSTISLTRPSTSSTTRMESPNRSSSMENGKAPAPNAVGFRPQNAGIVKVQPPKREDLQPSYAQTLVFDTEETHGWYSSMSALPSSLPRHISSR